MRRSAVQSVVINASIVAATEPRDAHRQEDALDCSGQARPHTGRVVALSPVRRRPASVESTVNVGDCGVAL